MGDAGVAPSVRFNRCVLVQCLDLIPHKYVKDSIGFTNTTEICTMTRREVMGTRMFAGKSNESWTVQCHGDGEIGVMESSTKAIIMETAMNEWSREFEPFATLRERS